ncbi:hypothetical protein QSH46_003395 [Xanthomonas arboricola pv. juglandis]|uniref:hypothetical protein n=1 Tax=Xanthomonas arboricola TaxID=56448 RepID=UPI00037E6D4E|nr:hypothetical protein [Xanthomonas arboricola]MDN0219081.1 hypothetical protein [Xanthomonas arboricola pv. juglandis]MDN0223621.1 hypothetical protein [Xanthomonas arboricola pv. juglandis]MDN0228075.1 hypothetical protein [Xanthomonas arboricola pv. juglandis]MDN0232046.1 hypothetical protein [Xanthomonas arboricola pv. juglandis]MDN0236608.1 hypothetical protein [Xanthomonas arboricola pv. juglandis]
MNSATPSLAQIHWPDHSVAVYAGLDLHAFAMFRDEVVVPSLNTLERRIEQMEESGDIAESTFGADVYADLLHNTVEGFLLTTQSMHERSLRGLMIAMARRKKWTADDQNKIKVADWSKGSRGVPALFQGLFDNPIQSFGDQTDLRVLRLFGNVLRHGDGPSAEELHELCPSLWPHWLPPGTVLKVAGGQLCVRKDALPHHLFENITLPRSVLDQMISAVVGFWEDIEFVRCNSFTNTNSRIQAHLAELTRKHESRSANRAWNPG